jgi:hypothetical protein
MYPRIGFVSLMGGGKSDHSKYLAQQFGFQHISIAEPIKVIARGIAPSLGLNPDDKSQMRPLLQAIGAEGRVYDPDIWVNLMIAKHELWDSTKGMSYVVDDVRFPNEGEALRRVGFHIIRLSASEAVRKARILKRDGVVDPAVFEHVTETAIAHVIHDELFENETEDDLARNLARLASYVSDLQLTHSPDDTYVGEGV